MSSRQGVYRKSRVFRTEGILIHIPKFIGTGNGKKELFIGEKPFVPHPDVVDPVVNFFVYYVDQGNIVVVTKFANDRFVLQVRYDQIRPNRELIIYDANLRVQGRFTTGAGSAQDIPGEFYGYPGSVIVELDVIPADPNVGWGG